MKQTTKTVENTPDEIVVDGGTIEPWHGLSPTDKARALGELLIDARGIAPAEDQPDLTAREAAALLRMTKPDGTPNDSFYDLAPALGGYKVPGGWRIPRAGIEAYKKNGAQR